MADPATNTTFPAAYDPLPAMVRTTSRMTLSWSMTLRTIVRTRCSMRSSN